MTINLQSLDLVQQTYVRCEKQGKNAKNIEIVRKLSKKPSAIIQN